MKIEPTVFGARAGIAVYAIVVMALQAACSNVSGVAQVNDQTNSVASTSSWESPAASISEVAKEADLIVKVTIIKVTEKTLEQRLPAYTEDGKTVTGEMLDVMPFSYSTARVERVLRGQASGEIVILQTGGKFPDNAPADVAGKHMIMSDDPIFEVGSTQILFLKDISGDKLHNFMGATYRIVNPVGRYALATDGSLSNFGENKDALPKSEAVLNSELVAIGVAP
jgi:hypothetical protein